MKRVRVADDVRLIGVKNFSGNDKLVDYCQHKDVFLRVAGKTDIMQKTYELANALAKFANDIEDFPENSLTPPKIARKRLQKFVDSGGKTFE